MARMEDTWKTDDGDLHVRGVVTVEGCEKSSVGG